jgi:hypothetical protein
MQAKKTTTKMMRRWTELELTQYIKTHCAAVEDRISFPQPVRCRSPCGGLGDLIQLATAIYLKPNTVGHVAQRIPYGWQPEIPGVIRSGFSMSVRESLETIG